MSRKEIIPKQEGRPAVVVIDGWACFVSVRDAEYRRQLKVWRQRLAAVHPDKGGTNAKFRKVMAEKLKWQIQEAAFYAHVGLLPPDGFAHQKVKLERVKRLKGGRG